MDIVKELESIRLNMMRISDECQRDAHEDNKLLRIRYILTSQAEAIRTIAWALKRQIDPHAD